jgi:hypothetical protein
MQCFRRIEMHAETSRFSISFHSPEMSCTGNHIGLPETPAKMGPS